MATKALALPVALVVLAGCGGATKTVTVTTTSAGTPTQATTSSAVTTTAAATGPASCAQLDVKTVTTGAKCNANGIPITIARQSDTLNLSTLSAHLSSVATATNLSNGYSSKTATGSFVIFKLAITNKTGSPQTFAPVGTQQTALVGHNATYSEDFDAENGPDSHSCISNDDPIQPGATKNCDVVYDIPTPAVNRGRTHGFGLLVSNFGDDLSPNATSTPSTAGMIIVDPIGAA
jgi:hypothetical protein